MVSSDWSSQAHNQTQYSTDQLKALSLEIAQKLEQTGGKKKPKKPQQVKYEYGLFTKEELIKKIMAKDKIIASLRK
jgi:hypothetical protein